MAECDRCECYLDSSFVTPDLIVDSPLLKILSNKAKRSGLRGARDGLLLFSTFLQSNIYYLHQKLETGHLKCLVKSTRMNVKIFC